MRERVAVRVRVWVAVRDRVRVAVCVRVLEGVGKGLGTTGGVMVADVDGTGGWYLHARPVVTREPE